MQFPYKTAHSIMQFSCFFAHSIVQFEKKVIYLQKINI